MANVKLSLAEMELVNNAEWILTKNRIIEKVYALFGHLSEQYKTHASNAGIPEEVLKQSPKISRGEFYEGLPWVMLDYPRYFKEENFFAIRTFFWWGNFFSITLQLKGRYQQYFALLYPFLQQEEWFVCVNEAEWQHHFGANNYCPLSAITLTEAMELPFIKLAKKLNLSEWESAEKKLADAFHQLISQF